MNVEQLIYVLSDLPGHYPVMVEQIVGGDIGTEDVDLHEVKTAGHGCAYVQLVPDPADNYATRTLIDAGLAAKAVLEEIL